MTPLRGILRLLKGEQPTPKPASKPDEPASAASRTRRNAASTNAASGGGPLQTDDETTKRRRGRRGGRGRNRGAGTAEGGSDTNETSERAPSGRGSSNGGGSNGRSSNGQDAASGDSRGGRRTTSRPSGSASDGRGNNSRGGRSNGGGEAEARADRPAGASRDRYQWGRKVDNDEADQRSRQANRRRRGVRGDLDAPLPEDVAFRPGEAGGDSSILPNRRRRPVGFHDTARTLVGGARSIGTWVKRDERHGNEQDPFAEVEPATADPREETADRNVVRAVRQLAVAPQATPIDPADDDDAVASDDDGGDASTSGDDTEERAPRRRGRRGGRGRGRSRAEFGESDGETRDDSDDSDDADRAPVARAASDDRDDEPEYRDDRPESNDRDDDRNAPDEHDDDDRDEDERRPARRPSRGRTKTFAPIADEDLPPAFAALGIHRTSLEQLARFGFAAPTPIQVEAIPALLKNLDVVGIAQTGSGKTIAFGIPMMEKLDPQLPEVQGIVLVPTRELAQQVLDVLAEVGAPWGLTAVGLLGGRSLKADFSALDNRPHIVVGTPGRILDHLGRQTLSLRHVRYAVLDEADQMLDIGFLPDIRRILSRTPQRRQTALFSATMPSSIRRLIWQFMTDPETVRVDAESSTVDTIEQIYFEVAQRDKVRAMRELIERELKGRSLIFCNMKRSVDHLARELSRDGLNVRALHGDLDQRQRDRVVQEFRNGEIDAVIATNVAARGLDIPEITHVVNYDVPANLEEYVHRIGRTGRAGRDGKAITLVCEWDMGSFDVIQKGVPAGIAREELNLYQPRTPAPVAAVALDESDDGDDDLPEDVLIDGDTEDEDDAEESEA